MTTPVPLPALLAHATGWLRSAGLSAGDRLATVTANDRTGFAVGWACALAGVVQVPVPADAPTAEATALLLAAAPAALAVVPGLGADAVRAATAAGLEVLPLTPRDAHPADPDASAPRTRAMAFTSGTTGRRKGVEVGVHDPAWGRAVLADEAAAFDHRHGERHLVVSPLYHSGPFRHALVVADRGGEVEVLPRFDVGLLLDRLRRWRPTSLFVVPTHLRRLLEHPALRRDDLASVTLLAHAGAPCPRPVKERLLALAPTDAVWEFYGSTEGQFTVCPPTTWRAVPGSVGAARPGCTLTVRGEGGTPLPAGEIGTVWVRPPAHARWRYWRDEAATARAWDGDAFTVGDLGHLDADGVLTLLGRRGDLVITGGVNVYPAEVEHALLGLDGVAEAVAFGVDDPAWGQRLVAAVVPTPGALLAPDDVLAALRERLSPARVPKQVLVVDDLPRTPTGKVRRTALTGMVTT